MNTAPVLLLVSKLVSYAESIPEGGYGTVEVALTAKELTIKGDQEVGPIINEWVLATDE